MAHITFDFNGILKILAQHLYNEKDVFIREMVQNSHDAIKQVEKNDPNYNGRIEINIDRQNKRLNFIDNGIGMDEKDLRDYLSRVGASTKKTYDYSETIGEFGIGFLSGFIVADKIEIYTKKVGNEQAFKWENEGAQDYLIEPTNEQQATGTKIILHIKDEFLDYLDGEEIKAIVKKYADFIPFPIFLSGVSAINRRIPINKIYAPWYEATWGIDNKSFEKQIDEIIRERFPYDYPLLTIPVYLTDPHTVGILYVASDDIPGINTAGFLDVFVKRMCIHKNEREILPSWAKFVKGMIDSTELTPTASRDSIIKNKQYYNLQQELGRVIINALKELAQTDTKSFESLCRFHEYTLKGMALQYEDLFDVIIELLPFDTNIGSLSLNKYKNSKLRTPYEIKYFIGQKNSFHFYDIANASKEVVFNCGHSFEKELLFKYAKKNEKEIVLIDLSTYGDENIYKKLPIEDEQNYIQLIHALGATLMFLPNRITVEVRAFEPAEMSGILINYELLESERKLQELLDKGGYILSGVNEIAQEQKEKLTNQPLRFFINSKNKLIQELITVPDLRDERYKEILLALYNSSFITSNQLNAHNLKVLYKQFQDRLCETIRMTQQLEEFTKEKEQMQKQLKSYLRRQDPSVKTSLPYIQIFMIISYATKYEHIEKMIKNILESPPFYFKVVLAKNELRTPEMRNNIQRLMIESDGFVGEISEPSLNVYLEVGWIFFDPDMEENPKVLFCKEGFLPPTDIQGHIFAKYKDFNKDDVNEKFEAEKRLHDELYKAFRELIDKRKDKERYLCPSLFSDFGFLREDKVINNICERYLTLETILKVTPEQISKDLGDENLGTLLPLIQKHFQAKYPI